MGKSSAVGMGTDVQTTDKQTDGWVEACYNKSSAARYRQEHDQEAKLKGRFPLGVIFTGEKIIDDYNKSPREERKNL